MKNTEELTDEMAKVFISLRDGKTTIDKAAALSNVAGKIIATVNVDLKACELSKTKPDIKFLKK